MRKFIFILLLVIISAPSFAEIKTFAIEGYLGDNIHFRLDLAEDTSDGFVWGETTYFKKNGSVSIINVYGAVIHRPEKLYDSFDEYSLTEIYEGKVCGHFYFEKDYSLENGSWFLDKKILDFKNVEVSNIKDKYSNLGYKKPNAESLLKQRKYFEIYHPIKYSLDFLQNGKDYSSCSIEINEPLLIPQICLDSIQIWIESRLEVSHQKNLNSVAKEYMKKEKKSFGEAIEKDEEIAEMLHIFNVSEQSVEYITLYHFHEIYTGGPHPYYMSESITFDKKTGKKLSWDNMFKENSHNKIAKIIDIQMVEQNGEDQLDPLPLGQPDSGPYIKDGKINFHFYPYHAGPWSSGMPSCSIPPKLLMPYFTEYAKAIMNLKD